MKNFKIKAFTLVELLVVITIIGILATGATTVYTSQIQKARDTTRINDLKAVQSAVEQIYQDNSEYPLATQFLSWASNVTGVLTYMELVPSDIKHWQTCNNAWGVVDCGYAYKTQADANGINYWAYELSVAFESKWNVNKKAWDDAWNDNARFEIWTLIGTVSTETAATIADGNNATTKWACLPAWWFPVGDDVLITINWDWTCS